MKKHAIIPIFIPHLGCPCQCVFCDQRQITGHRGIPTETEIRRTIATWLATLGHLPAEEIELAFFGGSFTALPVSLQEKCLSIGQEYLQGGQIGALHISTRPDCIDEEVLARLARYGVRTIELGCQSFDDEVLTRSGRGHDAASSRRAARLIKATGFRLGIQLMIGLPGDSMESCLRSAEETVALAPDLARLYPTLVLPGTELAAMYERGEYTPLMREEAVCRTAGCYRILLDAGIEIMRVGLKSTEIIQSDYLGAINQGCYHPAFRQLVESEIAKERILPLLAAVTGSRAAAESAAENVATAPPAARSAGHPPRRQIVIACHPAWVSAAAGHGGVNRRLYQQLFPYLDIEIECDTTLAVGAFRVYDKGRQLSLPEAQQRGAD